MDADAPPRIRERARAVVFRRVASPAATASLLDGPESPAAPQGRARALRDNCGWDRRLAKRIRCEELPQHETWPNEHANK